MLVHVSNLGKDSWVDAETTDIWQAGNETQQSTIFFRNQLLQV